MKSFIEFQKEEVELDEEQLNEGDHFDKADHHWDLSNHHDELASSHAEQGDVKKELSHKIKAETHMGKYHDHMSKFQKSRGSDSGGSSEEHNKWSAASSKNKAKLQAKLDKMNEEVEQIDELSKDTLASYEKKSRVAAHKHALASELKGLAADPAGSYAHKMMADKRHAGWKVAVKKLHTEESDTPFEGPYKQSKGTVTDKSGAKHTQLSNVRSLARNAIEKMKQKIRMAHLSPEVKAEKLARNEELVGGQKKLDIDKDGKIEKSDLEVLRAKKLKEDVTTAAQKLKAALDRHTEHAVAANRAGDHEATKVHQEKANKIKTQLGKLAKNEEVEIDESQFKDQSDSKSYTHEVHVGDGRERGKKNNTDLEHVRQAVKTHGAKFSGTTGAGNLFKFKSKDDAEKFKRHVNKCPNKTCIADHTKLMDEAAPTGIKIYHKGQDDKESHTMVFSAGDAAKHEKELKQQGRKVTGRAVMSGKTEGPRKNVTEEVEIDEAAMTDAEMTKREKIVKGMKKSFKDFTAKYGDRAKEVMYATATKKAMEEEVEEELEEDMDEGVTTRNGAVTVHKGTYGTSYQPNDDEDDEDTPEKKDPAVKRGRGRPAGAKSGAKTKGSSAGKSYGGLTIHSLRLPNNNK